MIAMDVDMVAKSIGHRFEDGDERAGHNFLEKIVQYPVYLPKVQASNMLDMFDELVISKFEELYIDGVSINMQPEGELIKELVEYILPLFNTVREMMIYRNTISFLLPMVYKEVHLCDFAMLEALKQFHANGYELIRRNRYLLTGEEFSSFLFRLDENTREERRKKRMEDFKQELLKSVTPNRHSQIGKILSHLIVLNENVNRYGVDKKRLCTSRYLDNYFLYDIRENLVGDQDIEELYRILPTVDDDRLLSKMEKIIHHSGYDELCHAIRQALNNYGEKYLQVEYIDKICYALSRLEKNKERKQFIESLGYNTDIDIVIILSEYINFLKEFRKDVDYKDAIKIMERILNSEEIHNFHIFLITNFKYRNYMSGELQQMLDNIVYNFTIRFINENGLDTVFNLSMMPIHALFSSWKVVNEEEYQNTIDKYMFSHSFDIASFVSRTIEMDSYGDSGSKKQSDDSFSNFCSIFDAKGIYNRLQDEELFLEPHVNREVMECFMRRYEREAKSRSM